MELYIIASFIWAIWSGTVAANRGGSSLGYCVVGVLLGPIGVILAYFVGQKCPFCRSRIHHNATRCPKCHGELTQAYAATPGGSTVAVASEVHEQSSTETAVTQAAWKPVLRIFVLSAACIAALLGILLVVDSKPFGSTSLTARPPSIFAPSPDVTMASYQRIQEGMTYEQVRSIIGKAGEELSRSEIAEYTTVMYMWKNTNGSNMNAMFHNDRLVQKAQFGLP
jgi:hypothetical protein